MRILLLSDLHIGEKAIDKSLNPYQDISNPLLLDSFYETLKNAEKAKPFDILIIPGDLTNKSYLLEYNLGQVFIRDLYDKINFKQKDFVFIPGNHDIDWSIFEGIPSKEQESRKHHKYNTLKDTIHDFSSDTINALTIKPFIEVWEYDDFIVVGFNSSWHDDALKESHYGIILDEHLVKLEECFKKISSNKSKVFTVHHHVINYKNPRADWVDFSALQNAEALLDLLHKYEFDFVFTGHKHVPSFKRLNRNDLKPLNVLCCGSFSCEMHSSISGIVRNCFHIVDVENKVGGICQGKIYSYEFHQSQGWIQCSEQSIIQFENPYGFTGELSTAISNAIGVARILFKTKNIIKLNDIESEIPSLEYLTIEARSKLCDKLCEKLKCEKFDKKNEIYFIKTT